LKILHVLDHSLPLHDGYSFRSQNIIRTQKKWGWEPVVLTSPKHEQSWKGDWKSQEEIEGFRYYRTGTITPSSHKVVSEVRLMAALGKRLRQVVKYEQPDLLHVYSPVLNLIPALVIGRLTGIPVVYEIRAFWEDAGVDQGTYVQGDMKYRTVSAIETFAAGQADHIGVICDGLKQDLIGRGIPEKKISILYNGINIEDFKPCDPDPEYSGKWNLSGKTVIGFIGSFYRYEGLDLLVDAFHQIAQLRDDVVLLLVGGGEMERDLRQQVKRLGLSGRAILPGRIPHERIPGVYAMVDIFAYPRYSVRLTELVTPLKPLEAMAMKKVVVASDVGGHRELIEDRLTGLLFQSGDFEDLAETLKEVLDHSQFKDDLQNNGFIHVRKDHNWEKTLSSHRLIYKKCTEPEVDFDKKCNKYHL